MIRTQSKIGKLFVTYLFLTGILSGWGGCGNSGTQSQPVQLSVDTTHVTTTLFYHSYSGYGKIQSRRSTPLIAQFSGRVHLNLPNGLHYRRGEIIYELTGREVEHHQRALHAELQRAEAELRVAESILKRRERLKEKQFVSPEQWSRRKLDVQVAETELQKIRNENEYFQKMTHYQAPFEGILQDLRVNEGDYVQANQMLGQFWETAGVKLIGNFYGNPAQFSKAINTTIRVEINDSLLVKGYLTYLESAPDTETGGREFWIRTDTTYTNLQPGMFVKYRLKYLPYRAAAVPDSALVMERGQYYVVVSEKGAFSNLKVRVGALEGALRELIEGPPPGTTIVTRNVFELFYRNLNQTMKPKD